MQQVRPARGTLLTGGVAVHRHLQQFADQAGLPVVGELHRARQSTVGPDAELLVTVETAAEDAQQFGTDPATPVVGVDRDLAEVGGVHGDHAEQLIALHGDHVDVADTVGGLGVEGAEEGLPVGGDTVCLADLVEQVSYRGQLLTRRRVKIAVDH